MGKRGFTLIELLAVIFVLGLISFVAIPTGNLVINDTKKNTLKSSVSNIASIAEYQCNFEKMQGQNITNIYTITDGTISGGLEAENIPETGEIVLSENCKANAAIIEDGYCAIKNGKNISVNSDLYNCNIEHVDIERTSDGCFIFDKSTKTITGYHFENATCPMDVSIPAVINGVAVEHIGDYAFENANYDYKAYFGDNPDGDDNADVVLDNLISRGATITSIRYMKKVVANPKKTCVHANGTKEELDINYVFTASDDYKYCSLSGYNVVDVVETGNLTGVNFSDAVNLISIGDAAFMDNKINRVYFGDNPNLVHFGRNVFFKNLIQGTINLSGLINLKTIGSGLFARNAINDYILPDGLEEILLAAFGYNNIETITIPDSVKNIEEYAFVDNPFTTIKFNNSIEKINDGVFAYGYLLGDLKIPDTVKSIGRLAFYNNTNLGKVTLGRDLESIGVGAFSDSSVDSIIFNQKLKYIGEAAFSCANITSLTTPSSLESIGRLAFSNGSIKTLKLNEGLKDIDEMAFIDNLITSISLPTTIQNLGNGCFARNKVTDAVKMFITKIQNGVADNTVLISVASTDSSLVTIPSNIITIESYALRNINASKIVVPDSVTTIKSNAFLAQYRRSSTIQIGSGITNIEADAFYCADSYYCKYNIKINKLSGSITGSPWGNPYATISWTATS